MSEATASLQERGRAEIRKWKAIVEKYQKSHVGRSSWQVVNSALGYVLLWVLIYLSRNVSWWLTIPLAVMAGGFLIRVFIILHDCGHGSFFKSRTANDIWGSICGVLTFTPYHHWRWQHAIHHATSGNLNKRGVGDIWTLTVREYFDAPRFRRFAYRVYRNPFVLFGLGSVYLFLVGHRLVSPKAGRTARQMAWATNIAVAGMAVGLSALFGFAPYLLIQLTILAVAGSAGIWLFYVQHQFEPAYWETAGTWEYVEAALQGSSFYKLPRVFQWFTGNIGFHHVHHLSPRIPNYNLEKCHNSDPLFRSVRVMTLLDSLRSATLHLWDESERKLVGFRHLKAIRHRRLQPGDSASAGDSATA